MKAVAAHLKALFGRRAPAVVEAYRQQIDPRGANGRLILRDLAVYCCMTRTAFAPGDPQATAFHAGRQDVYLHILEMLGLNPADVITDQLMEMTDED